MKPGGDCQLAEAMELCKTGLSGSGEDFVRSVKAAPEPMCILATNRQLDEIVPIHLDLYQWELIQHSNWEIFCYPNCFSFMDASS